MQLKSEPQGEDREDLGAMPFLALATRPGRGDCAVFSCRWAGGELELYDLVHFETAQEAYEKAWLGDDTNETRSYSPNMRDLSDDVAPLL